MASGSGLPPLSQKNAAGEFLIRFWPGNNNLDLVFGGGFLLFVLLLFVLGTLMPGYGYDLVPYLGAVFQLNGEAAGDLHHNAWNAVKQAAPPEVYADLANGDPYRQRQSTDANAFNSVLPLYSAKLGYIYLLKMLGSAFGWVNAAFWLNHLTGLLLGLFALFWMWKGRFLQSAPLIASILLLGNYFDAIRVASPDTFAAFSTILGIYFWLRNREPFALALFFVAFLFRPDTLLFVFALMLAAIITRQSFWRIGILFIGLLIASITIQQSVNHPGWWTHFYFSCVSIQPTLEGFHPQFTIVAYLKGLARGVYMSVSDFNWIALLAMLLFGAILLVKARFEFKAKQWAMLMACFLAIGGKFAVFPLPDDRIYMPLILAMAMILFEIWKPQLGLDDQLRGAQSE